MPQLVELIDGKSLFIFVERLITHILKASLPSPFYFTKIIGGKNYFQLRPLTNLRCFLFLTFPL